MKGKDRKTKTERNKGVTQVWVWQLKKTRKLMIEVLLMTLSIKNGGYAFLITLDLMFSLALWKGIQLLHLLSIKHLIKQILYENNVKLLKFKRSIGRFVVCLQCEILINDTWNSFKKSDGMVNLFFYHKFNVRMRFI